MCLEFTGVVPYSITAMDPAISGNFLTLAIINLMLAIIEKSIYHDLYKICE